MKLITQRESHSSFELFFTTVFFAFTLGFYMPSALFLGNINEFKVDYYQIVSLILLCGCVAFVLLFLVGSLIRSTFVFSAFLDIIFAGTLGAYIQGNFLNWNLPKLNGAQIDWLSDKASLWVSTIAWCMCFIFIFFVRYAKRDWLKKIEIYGSALLCAMQFVSLIVLLLTTHRTIDNGYATTKKDEFLLSDQENVVVFVVDTLDARWARDLINKDSVYTDLIRDFTFFDNVVGGGAPTILGMPNLFTGKYFDCETESLDQYYKRAYEASDLFSDFRSNGFGVNLYTSYMYLNHVDVSQVDNMAAANMRIVEPIWYLKHIYKLTAYYAAPYILKGRLYFYSGVFDDGIEVKSIKSEENVEEYRIDDPAFYRDFVSEGISLTDDKKIFVLYHLFGAHGPYNMDENAQYIEQSAELGDQQIAGVFKIITEYLDAMKKKGVYDNSTIIITADHGGAELYQNPAVYIKRKGETHSELVVDSSPITFRNVRATFVSTLPEEVKNRYGEDAFCGVTSLKEKRVLTADSVLMNNIGLEQSKNAYCRFWIGDPATDLTQIEEIPADQRIEE